MEGGDGHEERVSYCENVSILGDRKKKQSVCSVPKYVITFMSCLKSVIPTSAVWIFLFLFFVRARFYFHFMCMDVWPSFKSVHMYVVSTKTRRCHWFP